MRQHPLHPPFVHFPIALLSTTSLWDGAAWVTDDERWWFVAFVQCALGLACALPAATTGLLDLRKTAADGPEASTANRHMASVALALVAYGASLWLRGGTAPPAGADRLAAFACGGLGFLALAAAGWYGAELVYRFGVGRASEEPRASERREPAPHRERARLAP
jgi:uncharacterized membrane protein